MLMRQIIVHPRPKRLSRMLSKSTLFIKLSFLCSTLQQQGVN